MLNKTTERQRDQDHFVFIHKSNQITSWLQVFMWALNFERSHRQELYIVLSHFFASQWLCAFACFKHVFGTCSCLPRVTPGCVVSYHLHVELPCPS